MNKKRFVVVLMILIFITSFISVSAAAFSVGFYNIQNFFRGGWAGYDEILLFALLFILFTAAFTLALTKAFGETNRQIKAIAVIIALISSLSIVSATSFGLDQMAYIALGLGFLLLILLIQGILLKMGVKNKFVAFILALLISLFLALLMANLLSDVPGVGRIRGPHIGRFRFFDFDFIKFKKGLTLRIPGIEFRPVEIDLSRREAEPADTTTTTTTPADTTTTTTTPADTTTTTTTPADTTTTVTESGGKLNIGKLIGIILLFATLGGVGIWGGLKGYKAARKKWEERERKPKEKEVTEKDVEEIIAEIKRIMKVKMRTFGKIKEKVNKKEKLSEDLLELFHQKIRDPAFRQEPGSPEFEALTGENEDVDKLLHLEKELEKELEKLMKIEVSLTGTQSKEGKITKWREIINEEYAYLNRETAPADLNEALLRINFVFDSLFNELYEGGLLSDVKRAIITYLLISKKEIEAEEIMKRLTDHREVERWFKKGRYDELEKTSAEEIGGLEKVLGEEKRLLVEGENSLHSKISKQIEHMMEIVKLIEFIENQKEPVTTPVTPAVTSVEPEPTVEPAPPVRPEPTVEPEEVVDYKIYGIEEIRKLGREKREYGKLSGRLNDILINLNREKRTEIIEEIENLFKNKPFEEAKKMMDRTHKGVEWVIKSDIPGFNGVINYGIKGDMNAVIRIAEERRKSGFFRVLWGHLADELKGVDVRSFRLGEFVVNVTNTQILGDLEITREKIKRFVEWIEKVYREIKLRERKPREDIVSKPTYQPQIQSFGRQPGHKERSSRRYYRPRQRLAARRQIKEGLEDYYDEIGGL